MHRFVHLDSRLDQRRPRGPMRDRTALIGSLAVVCLLSGAAPFALNVLTRPWTRARRFFAIVFIEVAPPSRKLIQRNQPHRRR
jgi:hypothetical protein